ncbi:dihydrodipicolinate synthase family protein [Chlamydiota bacterium]
MQKTIAQGIWAASLTPLFPDFTCDHETLASHCFDLLQKGCAGVVLFGTTGEGPSFSVVERLEALDKLISKGLPPNKIILGNGSSSIPDTIALARGALRHGCAATLISPPSFFKAVKEEGVIAFYRAIIEGVGSPDLSILLYHIPQYSGVAITMRIVEKLRQEFPGQVVGLKESEGNRELVRLILQTFPGFQLFVGGEKQIVEAVQLGAAGSICGLANLYPNTLQKLYIAASEKRGDMTEVITLLSDTVKHYPFIASAKAVMEARRGSSWHTLRPPLVPLEPPQREALLASLKTLPQDLS